MIDAVFISDLHLHPQEEAITQRFHTFIDWAAKNTRAVYILGDFFHVWPGDDALDPWSQSIALRLSWLASHGVSLYFMHGNRDFLLGERFMALASLTLLKEPTVITLGDTPVLLVHGDRYCTKDKGHQWLRRLTRNSIFTTLFLSLPYSMRVKIVNKVREHSQMNRGKSPLYMDVVPKDMLKHMHQLGVKVLVHGHTHKPGLTTHVYQGALYAQYVLSDWDDNPTVMCYNEVDGIYFDVLIGVSYA